VKAYAVQHDDIPLAALHGLEIARALWERLPDKQPDGSDWSCHGLSGAVAQLLAQIGQPYWHWYTGHFAEGWEHSWLALERIDGEETILDVYPVAGASGPFLLCAHPFTPWRRAGLYQPGRQPFVAKIRQVAEKEIQECLQIFLA
jgi:hypothetical protein